MKTIAQLGTLEEAHLLRSVLAEEGIEAVVLDEGSGGHFLGSGSLFAGFRVQVTEEQAEFARPFVEQFTDHAVTPENVVPTAAVVSGAPGRGFPVRMFQILSVGTLVLHFVNRQVLQSQYSSVTLELRHSLDAMAGSPSFVALFERFGLVWEVIYAAALLGFAALWRRARVCFLVAWIWTILFTAVAGPGTAHGIPAVFSWIETFTGVFLLGVSCCPPAAEHFGTKAKR